MIGLADKKFPGRLSLAVGYRLTDKCNIWAAVCLSAIQKCHVDHLILSIIHRRGS